MIERFPILLGIITLCRALSFADIIFIYLQSCTHENVNLSTQKIEFLQSLQFWCNLFLHLHLSIMIKWLRMLLRFLFEKLIYLYLLLVNNLSYLLTFLLLSIASCLGVILFNQGICFIHTWITIGWTSIWSTIILCGFLNQSITLRPKPSS